MNDKTATHAYVGRCPVCCGWIMLRVDTGDKATARDVAACIPKGYPVDRVLIEEARQVPACKTRGQCKPGEPPPPKQGRLF